MPRVLRWTHIIDNAEFDQAFQTRTIANREAHGQMARTAGLNKTASTATALVTWPAIGNACTALRLRLTVDSGTESGTEWGANCAIYPLFSWEFSQANRTENPGVVSSILTLPIWNAGERTSPSVSSEWFAWTVRYE